MTGTINCWPFDAVSSAPSYTGEMLRQTTGGVIGGKTATRPLGAQSGVWPGTPNTVVSIAGTTVTVGVHGGVMDVEASATAGPYVYAVAVAPTLTINAANATNPRIDLISLVLSDPAEGDGTSVPSVIATYTAGTAASSPVAPAAPARSLVLAQVNVPHTGGGSATITYAAPYACAAGGVLLCLSSATYPASPYEGQVIYDLTLNLFLFYNGSGWQALSGFGRVASTTFSTDLTSTGTNGVTEVVGYSQAVPTISGRVYRVYFNGILNAGAAGNFSGVRCRFSTGSVTNSSTLAGEPQKTLQTASGSGGRISETYFFEFTATVTGTTNVAIGVLTLSGTGQTTIVGSSDTPTVVSVDCVV